MKKPQWDGKSRVSNDTYRKRFNEIFKKEPDEKKKKPVDNKTFHKEKVF